MEYCSSFATDFSFRNKVMSFLSYSNGFERSERKNMLTDDGLFELLMCNVLFLCEISACCR